jgi:hypothetical protein
MVTSVSVSIKFSLFRDLLYLIGLQLECSVPAAASGIEYRRFLDIYKTNWEIALSFSKTFRNATFFLDATLLTFYIVGGRMNTRHHCASQGSWSKYYDELVLLGGRVVWGNKTLAYLHNP